MECYKCGKDIAIEGSVFCNACGARLDGLMNCRKCNALITADSKFCNLCGASCTNPPQELNAAYPRAEQSVGVQRASGDDNREYVTRPMRVSGASTARYSSPKFWVEMCRNLLLFAFSVVIFSLSFGSVMTISPQGMGEVSKFKVNVSTINMIETMFSLGTSDTSTDMLTEFQEILMEDLSASTMNKLGSGQPLSLSERQEVDRALSKCNFLKLQAAYDIRTIAPVSSYFGALGMGLLALAVIVGSGVFMILSLISIILSLVKMNFARINRGKWYAFALPLLLIISLLAFSTLGSGVSIGVNTILIIVFALLGLGAVFSSRFIMTRESVQVKVLVGRLVALSLAIAMIVTVSSSMITANYSFKVGDKNIKVSHGLTAISYMVAGDMLANVDKLSETTAEENSAQLKAIAENYSQNLLYKSELVNALMASQSPFSWFFIAESYSTSAAIGWLFGVTPVFVIGMIGLCFLTIIFNMKNIYNNNKKKSNLLVNILTTVVAVVLFTISLIAVLSINSITSLLCSEDAMLVMTIGAGSILLMIFSFSNIFQSEILSPTPTAKVEYIDVEQETL